MPAVNQIPFSATLRADDHFSPALELRIRCISRGLYSTTKLSCFLGFVPMSAPHDDGELNTLPRHPCATACHLFLCSRGLRHEIGEDYAKPNAGCLSTQSYFIMSKTPCYSLACLSGPSYIINNANIISKCDMLTEECAGQTQVPVSSPPLALSPTTSSTFSNTLIRNLSTMSLLSHPDSCSGNFAPFHGGHFNESGLGLDNLSR